MTLKTSNNRKTERKTYNNQERAWRRELCFDSSLGLFQEGLMAEACELSSLSRISSRGFTRAQQLPGESQTAKFAGMNGSRVIAARSGSRPGMDLLSGNVDIESVLNIDLIDIAPSDSDLIDGISNSDSLIKENHLGMDEEPVTCNRDCYSPEKTRNEIFAVGVENSLSGEQDRTRDRYSSEEIATSRTEDLCIGHVEIFSRKAA